MTALLESTSSAPTLAERARAEAASYYARQMEQEIASEREEFQRRLDVLLLYLRDKMGASGLADVSSSDGSPRAVVDGLVFTLRDLSHPDSFRDRERLHVLVPCARNCGKDLWLNVESLRELDAALEGGHEHPFACLQQFDAEGDPITDRNGNPLPPPREPQPSLWDKAEVAARSVHKEAVACGRAHADVMALEDERPLVKAKCIEAMIGTPNPLGRMGAVHSASSAEAIVEQYADYWNHRQKQAAAEVERWRCLGAYESAKRHADLALEAYRAQERGS